MLTSVYGVVCLCSTVTLFVFSFYIEASLGVLLGLRLLSL